MSDPFIQKLVTDAHRVQQYRPVVVGIVFYGAPSPLVLCVCSAKNQQEAGFIQGGVERGEVAVDALRRELLEKAKIKASWLDEPLFLGHQDLDVEDNRPDRRGYARGKRYLFYRVVARPTRELELDPRELFSYIWATPDQVDKILADTLPAKRDMLLAFLDKAYRSN